MPAQGPEGTGNSQIRMRAGVRVDWVIDSRWLLHERQSAGDHACSLPDEHEHHASAGSRPARLFTHWTAAAGQRTPARQLDQLTSMACHPSARSQAKAHHHVCFITAALRTDLQSSTASLSILSCIRRPTPWLALVLYCSQDHHAFIHLRQQ